MEGMKSKMNKQIQKQRTCAYTCTRAQKTHRYRGMNERSAMEEGKQRQRKRKRERGKKNERDASKLECSAWQNQTPCSSVTV